MLRGGGPGERGQVTSNPRWAIPGSPTVFLYFLSSIGRPSDQEDARFFERRDLPIDRGRPMMISNLRRIPQSTRSLKGDVYGMTEPRHPRRITSRSTAITVLALMAAAAVGISGCASTDTEAPAEPVTTTREAVPSLAERWGVEIVALRLTGANYMLDFRYKVLEPDKAATLFERANKPVLIHHETGARLEVPRPAKTGPLRPTNPPEAGRIYFMLFSNPGVVQPGDEVTIKIGDFEADVVVE